MMSSRLVETVMINVDDLSDAFLTCGTCFSGYNTGERAAKLLPCSHTICRSCLEQILLTEIQSDIFRCPICRENVAIPSGGANSFPPAFIVNQLLDLLATQRRDVVPKCCIHPTQELLFCETCDIVFCSECCGRNHAVGSLDYVGANDVLSGKHDLLIDEKLSSSSAKFSFGDSVFDGSENSSFNTGLNHNVITFSVALKRCSEIMFYKMHLCIQELNTAQQAVSDELERLSNNTNACVESINSRFAEILALVQRRQNELLDMVKRLGEDKRRALTDQLSLIETERDLIRRECGQLKGVMDVRTITKAISYLNDKLDTISGLTEPRENAFLLYQDCVNHQVCVSEFKDVCECTESSKRHNLPIQATQVVGTTSAPAIENNVVTAIAGTNISTSSDSTLINSTSHVSNEPASTTHLQVSMFDIARCLAGFGRLVVSTTYPALCTVRLPNEMVINLTAKAIIQAVDYHGRPQSTGGTDPIEIKLSDPRGHLVRTNLLDLGNGSYELSMLASIAGCHKLSIQILSRPIRGSPFFVNVKSAQRRHWVVKEGSDERKLIQPFAVALGLYPQDSRQTELNCRSVSTSPQPTEFAYVLDTGNSRMLVLNPSDGSIHTTLIGEALSGQAATGMVWSPFGLWIVNWRAKQLFLLDPSTDQVTSTISSTLFKEPTSITRCPLTDRLFVADNEAGCVFVCDPTSGAVNVFIGTVQQQGAGCTTTSSNLSLKRNTLNRIDRNSLINSVNLSLQPKICKRIIGLCMSDLGELIISTGSSIRIYTSTGQFLCELVPPLYLNEDNFGTNLSAVSPRASLHISCSTNTATSHDPTDTCDNRITDSVNLDRLSLSDVYTKNGTGVRSSFRGQFGGVVFASALNSLDKLGRCIMASYSDRRRSGVVVWSEVSWNPNCQQTNGMCAKTDSASQQSTVDQIVSPDHTTTAGQATNITKPYLVEVEPPCRRLAGLSTLSNCRDVVIVDQGAQSVYRIQYA